MTIAFVLSGGASLGAVQVGMLTALAERGITPDLIIGTSVGAVNGAWLAGDRSDPDLGGLADLWKGLRRNDIFPLGFMTGFVGFSGRGNHLVGDHGLRRILRKNLKFSRLEQAQIPLHVVATDVCSGADICLSDGDAEDAISASTAIPGLLPPVVIGGRALMDGGAVNNTPISHAVAMGATSVWVLTTGSSCGLTDPPSSALGMALHGLTRAINQRVALDVARFEDVVELHVVPPLCPVGVGPSDFSHAAELISRAEVHTRGWLEKGMLTKGPASLLTAHGHF